MKAPQKPKCPRCYSETPHPACDRETGLIDVEEVYAGRTITRAFVCPQLAELAKDEERKAVIGRVLSDFAMPARYASASLDSPPAGRAYLEAYTIAEKWLADARRRWSVLVLTGGNGAGKTHLACAIGNRAGEQRLCVAFRSTVDFLQRLKNSYNADTTDTERDIVNAAMASDLLILDDWGKHFLTEWSDNMLFHLVDKRYGAGLPVVLTINSGATTATDPEIRSAIGSRLRHEMTQISLPNKDLRARAASTASPQETTLAVEAATA